MNEMKCGKASCLDGFPVECLKTGGLMPHGIVGIASSNVKLKF